MKIKKYIYFLLICGLVFCFPPIAKAQEKSITFADGITVAIKVKAKPPLPENSPLDIGVGELVDTLSKKNIIHRLLTDHKNKLYFGYDLEVSATADDSKFRVAFRPLSLNPNKFVKVTNFTAFSIDKYPEEMLVEDGDIISFDTLENPQAKIKFSDLIKVTRQRKLPGHNITELQPAKDFTMQATNLEAFINDKKVAQVSSLSGSNLSFYFQDKGRFIMSIFPRKGFNLQKIGIVEGNKLSFTFNGDNYKFVSSSPIIGSGGKWNVWVLYDPNYKPSDRTTSQFESGEIEDLSRKSP
jgi:hypothetical protein